MQRYTLPRKGERINPPYSNLAYYQAYLNKYQPSITYFSDNWFTILLLLLLYCWFAFIHTHIFIFVLCKCDKEHICIGL